jgi:hypothetical protein
MGNEIGFCARDAGIFTVAALFCMYDSFNLQDNSAGASDTRVNVLLQQ